MAAGKRDIEITKGDNYVHVVTINTRVAGVLTPVNITGRTYAAKLRKAPSQAAADATFTVAVTNGAAGELTITLSSAITATLRPDCYQWDLEQTAGGIVNTILRGEAKVIYSVTW